MVMKWIEDDLRLIDAQQRLRALNPIDRRVGMSVHSQTHALCLFSSNDYLGLSQHQAVRDAVSQEAQRNGQGIRGAALICGHSSAHEALESDLAHLKGTENALLMPTGYQANVGLLSALGTEETTIFSDALNHASIIDGCRLSKAKIRVYRHRDMTHLEDLLRTDTAKRRVVVTDEVFSMDGHRAPLVELAKLKESYGFILITDSAHSTGVFGTHGAGLVEAAGITEAVDFQVGTLSKSIGAQGGFVATSTSARTWLLNRARAFIFSTALPTPTVSGARAAIRVMAEESEHVESLWNRVTQLCKALRIPPSGPIVPVIVGRESDAMTLSASLWRSGFHVPAIRPPTVPDGTCRLRIALSALHQSADVDQLIAALNDNRP